MKRVIPGIITLALICCIALPCFAANEKRTVKVGFPIQKNLTEIKDGGEYSGYTYEYIMKIAQYAGWNIEFVTAETSEKSNQIPDLLEMLKNGEIDVLGTMLKTEEAAAEYAFSSENYGNVYTTLLSSASNTVLKSDGNIEQSHLNIAVLKNEALKTSQLDLFCRSSNIDYTTVECGSLEEQLEKIMDGSCDTMLSSTFSPQAGTKTVAQFSPTPFYFVTGKNAPSILSELDEAMNKINITSPDFQPKLHDKYFRLKESALSFTQNELDYIADKKVLKALVPYSVPPLVAKEKEKDVYYGIFVSFSTYLQERTGLHIELCYPDGGQSLNDAVSAKNCDIILGVASSYQYALNRNIIFSEPLLSLNTVMFYNKNANINDLSKLTMARSYSQPKPQKTSENINEYTNISECVLAVEGGSADYGYGSSLVVDYCINNSSCTSIAVIPLMKSQTDYSIAFPSNTDATLISIVNKVILATDSSQINSFAMQTHFDKASFNIISFIRQNPVAVTIVCCILVLIIVVAIFFALLSRREKKQNTALRRANDAKDMFISRMSHELLTPMNSIISNSAFIKDESNLENIKKYNNGIYTSSQYMLAMIHDILTLSAPNGKDEKEEPTALAEIASTLEALFETTLKQKNIIITKTFQSANNIEIICSKHALIKALALAVSNAVNAAFECGKVALIIECTDRSDTSVLTRFIIRAGSNKAENEASTAKQAESDEHENNYENYAAELAIAKEIVENIGGHFYSTGKNKAEPEYIIEMKTPYLLTNLKQEYDEISPNIEYNLAGRRILVVDDVPINIEILDKMLSNVNATTEKAFNGKAALDKFAQSPEGYYDAILMDIRMPIMDGIEAAEKIRALPRPDAKTVAIIAVSANAFESDITKSLLAGMNYHISKPIDTKRLYHELSKYMKNQQ